MARKERKIMATFQDNLRAIRNIIATGPDGSYRWSNPNGNWRSRALRSVSRVPNVYTDQEPVGEEKYTPTDPTTDPFFLRNYRNVTKSLGAPARAWKTRGQKLPNVDTETKAIMDRIKLPSYADAMTEGKRMELAALATKDIKAAVEKYQKESDEWDEDNFYYKLRAAQKLKKEPEKAREGFLNNFNVSLYDAKNELDRYISRRNKEDAQNLLKAGKGLQNIMNNLNNGIEDIMLRATGQRESYTDKNGVKHTITTTSGPGNPEELAKSLGDNNSFRLYSKDDYDENGELTDEAKSRGPSAWNSNTTNPDGSQKTENSGTQNQPTNTQEDTGEIIEYTYKPGDTFGQVITNLGLTTDNGLWGPNGDVAYYTQQLVDQGVWADGVPRNIPIGTTIKLRRRK